MDYRGKRMPEKVNTLIVPIELEKTAFEITQSMLAPYTTDNESNFHRGVRVLVDDNLSSSTAFFGQAANHKLTCFVGKYPTPGSYVEDATQSLVKFIEMDAVFGARDWYGLVGCAGA